jgi:hypothetical protein
MRELKLVVVLSLLAGCSMDRDEQDQSQEAELDRWLAPLPADDATAAASLSALHARVDPLTVTADQLVALAGPNAALASQNEPDLLRELVIEAPGGRTEGLSFIRAVVERSVRPLSLELTARTFKAKVVFIDPNLARPVRHLVPPLSSDNSWCFTSCQERRRRIVEKGARLKALEKSAEPLRKLQLADKEMKDLEPGGPGPAAGPILDALSGAEWFGPGFTFRFGRPACGVIGPLKVEACQQTFARLATCDQALLPTGDGSPTKGLSVTLLGL